MSTTNRKVHPFGIKCPACGEETTSNRRACTGECTQHPYLNFYHSWRSCVFCGAMWSEVGKGVDVEEAWKNIQEANRLLNGGTKSPVKETPKTESLSFRERF